MLRWNSFCGREKFVGSGKEGRHGENPNLANSYGTLIVTDCSISVPVHKVRDVHYLRDRNPYLKSALEPSHKTRSHERQPP